MEAFLGIEDGRISFRVEGDWWVAYYARAETMDGAQELARIKMAIVKEAHTRKEIFMWLIQSYVMEFVPAIAIADAVRAPEHERSGRG